MIELYGTDMCSDCKIAKMLFEKYGIEYRWVDVSQINGFNGEIPRIKSYDDTIITGLGNIKSYLQYGLDKEVSI